MKARARLRQALTRRETLHVVGAHDALSALLIQQAGFDGVYVGSYSTQATFLAKPDLDLMTKTERLLIVRNVVKAVEVPVIADMEEGYGNAIAVMEAIRDFEAAGLAGIHLDDEQTPSKCPVMQGIPLNRLIDVDEMCGKIRAAVRAREDPDFLIIARSDVVGTVTRHEYYAADRIEEVVARSNAYVEAGADCIMVMAFTERELDLYAERIRAPLVGLYAPVEPHPFREFERRGYFMAIGTIAPLYMYVRSLIDGLRELKETADWNAVAHRMVTDAEFFTVLGLEKYRAMYEEFSIR